MSGQDNNRPIAVIEAEQAVIGALLFDNDAIDRIAGLKAEHFFRADHRTIFAEVVAMLSANQPADAFTVFGRISAKGGADAIGGIGYLNDLVASLPSSANVAHYAEMVIDRAQKRGLAAAGSRMQEMAHNPNGATAGELVDRAQAEVERLAEGRAATAPILAAEGLSHFLVGMERRFDGEIDPARTGYDALDDRIAGGMKGGDLIIVAARPSMGKTAFSLNVASNVAESKPTLFLSMEMSAEQLHARMMARHAGVNFGHLIEPKKLTDMEWGQLPAGVSRINDLSLYFDDQPGLSLLDVRSKARGIKRRHGLGLIVVDYLGLMTGGQGDNRTQEIGSYSRGLKALAKELDVPIIALAQLNRELEKRPNKRPVMSDLRDSGEIEQDADTILFLYRDEVYHPDSPDRGLCEVIIGKQRNGPLGHVALGFQGEFQRFSQLSAGASFGRRDDGEQAKGRATF
ncbi:replicative DNA helicase [Pandoraea horticolens]|uniref:Replicative DNA helicase n=1 Tax=Pandoraea horticolens TaxID=2508298 RepID=A0A5E4SHL4_9BURK|nr:replicative DNA helicase [Pandoraea horticolens]VVD74765.1 replicative DNA helicase [Pandoraea horticolens]